ncbi:uncharacterized protein LOC128850746 isoform X2 [Cuculus canorus]|uniref:uncharacterized protein LOC128850746 isoform X2 n=1 Tax=Cuculus canorus TaxID=55661 RepID=UPI0023AA3AED|nr:uncharacterized protein LOC128850746 isoform X2 [Cuculus canorus]
MKVGAQEEEYTLLADTGAERTCPVRVPEGCKANGTLDGVALPESRAERTPIPEAEVTKMDWQERVKERCCSGTTIHCCEGRRYCRDSEPDEDQGMEVFCGVRALQHGNRGDIVTHVMALYRVEGGPTYEVALSGEASLVNCLVDIRDRLWAAGTTRFSLQRSLKLSPAGLGLSPLPATLLAIWLGSTMFECYVLYPSWFLVAIPTALAKAKQPQVQVGHLEPEEISLKGKGNFPRFSLDLPWNIKGEHCLSAPRKILCSPPHLLHVFCPQGSSHPLHQACRFRGCQTNTQPSGCFLSLWQVNLWALPQEPSYRACQQNCWSPGKVMAG